MGSPSRSYTKIVIETTTRNTSGFGDATSFSMLFVRTQVWCRVFTSRSWLHEIKNPLQKLQLWDIFRLNSFHLFSSSSSYSSSSSSSLLLLLMLVDASHTEPSFLFTASRTGVFLDLFGRDSTSSLLDFSDHFPLTCSRRRVNSCRKEGQKNRFPKQADSQAYCLVDENLYYRSL